MREISKLGTLRTWNPKHKQGVGAARDQTNIRGGSFTSIFRSGSFSFFLFLLPLAGCRLITRLLRGVLHTYGAYYCNLFHRISCVLARIWYTLHRICYLDLIVQFAAVSKRVNVQTLILFWSLLCVCSPSTASGSLWFYYYYYYCDSHALNYRHCVLVTNLRR